MEGFRGLLADLDALFGAEIARQEDEAADDLAISLQSDSRLVEVLARGSFQLVMDERTIPVESLGRDFVESATFIVPLGRYHFIACTGERARSTDLSFVDRLRSLARSRAIVELALEGQMLNGRLSSVSPEHLLIEVRTGSAAVPLGSIRWVGLFPEDSMDRSHDFSLGGCDLGSSARSTCSDRVVRALHGMRHHRLLTRSESGSAPVEATFAIVFLMTLVLGVVEVAFAVYSRNVVAAAAHEGARAAVEIGRDADEAARIARLTVETSAGGLVTDLHVDLASPETSRSRTVVVRVTGRLKPFGPVPIAIPFSETAHAVANR